MNVLKKSGDPVVDGLCEKMDSQAHGDPMVHRVIGKLIARSEAGQKTYGTTLDAANLTTEELLNHAQQEAMDLANYLETLITRHEVVTNLEFMQEEALTTATVLEAMLAALEL